MIHLRLRYVWEGRGIESSVSCLQALEHFCTTCLMAARNSALPFWIPPGASGAACSTSDLCRKNFESTDSARKVRGGTPSRITTTRTAGVCIAATKATKALGKVLYINALS